MSRLISVPIFLIAFALFCFFCIQSHALMIQHDVLARTAQAFMTSGLPVDGLSVDGRDVWLSGAAGSLIVSDEARSIARSINGVRIVKVNLTNGDAGAPRATAQPQREINTLLQTKTVDFDSGSVQLTSPGRATLDQIVPILTGNPGLSCTIEGYTDSDGDPQKNVQLSVHRANATKDYLVSKGILASRLSAVGFGDQKPLASNDTPDGRRQNRRIEFVVRENH